VKIDSGQPAEASVDSRQWAARAEAAGFDRVSTSELSHDPFVALALAATVTTKIELGTSIALAFARNPMSLSVQANDIQMLSKGRLVLGIGSQVKAHITRRFSMPWSHPAPRMREYILAMRAIFSAWSSDTALNFDGDFYSHTLMTPVFDPGPNPFGPPRILLAAVGEQMTQVAGEVADGMICHGFTTERYLREVTLPALALARGEQPADGFEICGSPFVATGRDEEEMATAVARARSQVAFYASTPSYQGVMKLHGWSDAAEELHTLSRAGRWRDMDALVDDEMLQAFVVVAEPHRVAAELVSRYDGLLTRMTLAGTESPHPDLSLRIVDDVRRATSASAPRA